MNPLAHRDRDDRLGRRVEELFARLGPADEDLRAPVHVPGAFADLVAGFDFDAFEARIASEARIAPGRHDLPAASGGVYYQGDTSYHAWYEDEAEQLVDRKGSPDSFRTTTRLPLPEWALDLQQEILRRVYVPGRFGWSTEIFYSREGAASMGAHADNDDVYTIQLYGEKIWLVAPYSLETIAEFVDAGVLLRDGPESAWHFAEGRRRALDKAQVFHMRPGDFLATPPFALHHVTATGAAVRSLSFNVSVCREEVWERFLTQRGGRSPGGAAPL